MADQKQNSARRTRTTAAAKQTLTRLLQARDEVDAAAVDRRQREEAALAQYAEAEAKGQSLADEQERLVADLQRQIEAVRDNKRQQLAAVDQDRGTALLALTELGRSAEDLAAMTGIGAKRIRAMVRAARTVTAGAPAGSDTTAADQPSITAASVGDGSSASADPAPTRKRPVSAAQATAATDPA